jgi:catechol 2,3-dioxygenase-like lactoylglutathione lyase family enzyme
VTLRLDALCFDANDPGRLARFWAEALGWELGGDGPGGGAEVELVPTDGTTLRILFVAVPEPKAGQNRIHLDLTTASLDDQQQTVARLLELGGRHLDIGQSADEPHVVLADPEGNELCIIEPGNRFLAGCGRLGAVNCDGTRATGLFWHQVLDWPLVWDQDEETAIQAPSGTGPKITWSGPPLIPKPGKNRLHLHVAPAPGADGRAELDRLVSLGATVLDGGSGDAADRVVLADPDGNELCLVHLRA